MRTVGRAQKTVLIVDERASLRSAIAAILREAGYAVLEAANGAEGLRLAERHAPEGVLVDLAMPGCSGLEVLKELKQRDPTRDTRVVFASAYALAVLGDLAQGADDPLHMPFDLADRYSCSGVGRVHVARE
jgi:CheY-like chemotaxis protein